ncbi:hypothetical protein ALC57_00142 [Trachymyrmex cornetzi]|uniref:Uncharacterized protein n=1 Tax=Trachymyrmex cornetzi TaxID=471704 RepID=A0A151K2Z6_9HYME|nr:hypothetical protein ALC57_00142 [Trachymyrmex cornetzi]
MGLHTPISIASCKSKACGSANCSVSVSSSDSSLIHPKRTASKKATFLSTRGRLIASRSFTYKSVLDDRSLTSTRSGSKTFRFNTRSLKEEMVPVSGSKNFSLTGSNTPSSART